METEGLALVVNGDSGREWWLRTLQWGQIVNLNDWGPCSGCEGWLNKSEWWLRALHWLWMATLEVNDVWGPCSGCERRLFWKWMVTEGLAVVVNNDFEFGGIKWWLGDFECLRMATLHSVKVNGDGVCHIVHYMSIWIKVSARWLNVNVTSPLVPQEKESTGLGHDAGWMVNFHLSLNVQLSWKSLQILPISKRNNWDLKESLIL